MALFRSVFTLRTRYCHGAPTLAAFLVVALGLALATPRAVVAQDENIEPDGDQIIVELNEGKLIRLDRPASSVFIANPAIADVSVKSTRLIYLFGTHPGETTLFAVDPNDEVIANLKVTVVHNLSRLQEGLDRLIPDGQISPMSVDGGIVLIGSVNNATEAEDARRLAARFISENEEVINKLQVTEPNQINLRVRIAEVSRQVINQFGINWEAAFTGSSDFLFGIATGNPLLLSTLFGANSLSPALAGDGSFITRPGLEGSSLFFQSTAGNFDINGLIDLLADDGLVSILAEPNLTALSGETASFLAGGEFPVPVPQREDTITIEFREFGVSLAFTPTLIGDNRINMRVAPEVSQLSSAGAVTIRDFQIPSLTVRRAETTIELGSGQSFAIAGLLLDNTQQDSDRVPGLADIPILGPLFESDRFERNETELVIIVTPYIVEPVESPDLLSLPTDPYLDVDEPPQARGLAMSPSIPQTLPLNSGTAGLSGAMGRSGFIIE